MAKKNTGGEKHPKRRQADELPLKKASIFCSSESLDFDHLFQSVQPCLPLGGSGDENHGGASGAMTSPNPRDIAEGDSTSICTSGMGSTTRAMVSARGQLTKNVAGNKAWSSSKGGEDESPPLPPTGNCQSPCKSTTNANPQASACPKCSTTVKRQSPNTTGDSCTRSGTSKHLHTLPDDLEEPEDKSMDPTGETTAQPQGMANKRDKPATGCNVDRGYQHVKQSGRSDHAVSGNEEQEGDN
ncbi:hypothetical protein FRC08_012958 [Ceratobasidium sp. 394]|nr:hypothetical protein FRC08_012958 [Ceratobasidium sp. 394]